MPSEGLIRRGELAGAAAVTGQLGRSERRPIGVDDINGVGRAERRYVVAAVVVGVVELIVLPIEIERVGVGITRDLAFGEKVDT